MNSRRPNSLRLQNHDYTKNGAYFVTIVTYEREAILGDVKNRRTHLSNYGKLVTDMWKDLPNRYSHVSLDEFVVMPDHIHGILWINTATTHESIPPVGAGSLLTLHENSNNGKMIGTLKPAQTTTQLTSRDGSPRAGLKSTSNQTINAPDVSSINEPAPTGNKSLSEIIRNFKTVSAKRINLVRRLPGTPVWQRGFHDRIIRDEDELNAVRYYIQTNPSRWTNHHDS
jgi:putative transposase